VETPPGTPLKLAPLEPQVGGVPADALFPSPTAAPTRERRFAWDSLVQWMRRGAWAIADQVTFAASNFLLNIALARLISPASYGTFTLAYTIFLLLATVHTSLIVEPMLVFGAGKFADRSSEYLSELLRSHWQFGFIAGGLLLAGAAVTEALGYDALAQALVALAVATPLVLLQWLTRRACYVRFETPVAAQGGVLYLLFLGVGAYLLHARGLLSSVTAILLMGVGSLASAVWIMIRLHMRPFARSQRALRQAVVAEHWEYGRWVIGSNILGWAPQSIYFFVLPLTVGIVGTATMKALINLILPVLHTYLPLSILLVPALVRAPSRHAFKTTVSIASFVAILCSTAYWLLLGTLHQPLVSWIYNGRYVADAGLLWILGIVPISGAVVAVAGGALRALERPNLLFRAYAISTAVSATLGLGLLFTSGLRGAVIGYTLSSIATAITMAVSLRHELRTTAAG
jgi:O-antigen/teichoic acid export membrane protein